MRTLVQRAGLDHVIELDSAGTINHHAGELADERARRIAKAKGFAITHRARQILPDDYSRFDYLLAMDAGHLSVLTRRAPANAKAIMKLFRSFDAASAAESDVPDPYYGEDSDFEHVLELCERACDGLLAHLRKRHELA